MKAKAGIDKTFCKSESPAFSWAPLRDAVKYSNLHVGIVTAVASLLAVADGPTPLNLPCHLFIFFSTIFIYNFDHGHISKADWINSPRRCNWFLNNTRLVAAINIICLSGCVSCLFYCHSSAAFLTVSLLLFTCISYKRLKNVKLIPGLKSFVISAVWSTTCVVLTTLWYGNSFNNLTLIIFSACFIAALINSLLFDLKDFPGDFAFNLQTIPVTTGKEKAFKVCAFLSLILTAFAFYTPLTYGFGLTALYYAYISFNKPSELRSFSIDSALILSVIGSYFI